VAWGCVCLCTRSTDGFQIGFPSANDEWLRSFGWNPSLFITESPSAISNHAATKHWDIDPNSIKDSDLHGPGWLDQWDIRYPGHDFRRFDWTMRGVQYPFAPFAGQYRAGWPLRALYGECRSTAKSPGQFLEAVASRAVAYQYRYAWRPKNRTTYPLDYRALPLRPVWPGFAINTIFYAAILWLLFAVPGWARRRLRARRGQCPACAYPVGSSTVCTECGKTVRRAR